MTGYLVYVLGIWDGISEMLLWWELLVEVLNVGCPFRVIGEWIGRSCFALALLVGCLLFCFSFVGSIACAAHFALLGGCFCSLLSHTRLDRVSSLCLRYLGWYLRNAIVVGTFGRGTERRLSV